MNYNYESLTKLTDGFTKSNLFHKVQLTPEMASKIKLSNNRNRPFRKYLARQYAKDMRNGTFLHNGDSMRFDVNGNMVDGQHRTEAVLLSGCTIEVNIETGLPINAYDTIDQGLKRSTSDILFTMDIKDSAVVAAGLGLYMNLIDKTIKGKRKSIAPHVITKYLKDNTGLVSMIEDCALRARKYSRALGSSVSANMFMAILYLARKKHGDKAIDFFDKLASYGTVPFAVNEPVSLVWHRIWKVCVESKRLTRHQRIALIIKAYNMHHEGKKTKILKWNEAQEDFPIIN